MTVLGKLLLSFQADWKTAFEFTDWKATPFQCMPFVFWTTGNSVDLQGSENQWKESNQLCFGTHQALCCGKHGWILPARISGNPGVLNVAFSKMFCANQNAWTHLFVTLFCELRQSWSLKSDVRDKFENERKINAFLPFFNGRKNLDPTVVFVEETVGSYRRICEENGRILPSYLWKKR